MGGSIDDLIGWMDPYSVKQPAAYFLKDPLAVHEVLVTENGRPKDGGNPYDMSLMFKHNTLLTHPGATRSRPAGRHARRPGV